MFKTVISALRKAIFLTPQISKILVHSLAKTLHPYHSVLKKAMDPLPGLHLDLLEAQMAPLNPAKLVTFPEKNSFNSFNYDNPGANAYLQALHVGCSMTGLFSENAYKLLCWLFK